MPRLEIDISPETAALIQERMLDDAVSVTEFIRRAVACYAFMDHVAKQDKGVQLSTLTWEMTDSDTIAVFADRTYLRLMRESDSLLVAHTKTESTIDLQVTT